MKQLNLDRNEKLYILYSGSHLIKIMTKDFNFLNNIGQNILMSPCGLAVNDSDVNNIYIYVSDINNGNNLIYKFNTSGNVITSINAINVCGLLNNAQFGYMDCDVFGNLYVVDPVNNKIYKFNPELEYLDTCSGGYQKPFTNLRSVAMDKIYNYQGKPGSVASYGMVFTLEKQRVQYFDIGMDIVRINAVKDFFLPERGGEAEIEYVLTEPGYQTIKVLDGDGNYIKTLKDNETVWMAGKKVIKWDGKDVDGRMVVGGDYIIEITARDFYKNVTKNQLCPVTVYYTPTIWSLTAEPKVITPGQNITKLNLETG
ncbi:MAG: hypothetical protein N2Z20_02830 [Elusimicrobiales bacterium]|nr:hypothetical protein [Elusimicrobiales bacterium]